MNRQLMFQEDLELMEVKSSSFRANYAIGNVLQIMTMMDILIKASMSYKLKE